MRILGTGMKRDLGPHGAVALILGAVMSGCATRATELDDVGDETSPDIGRDVFERSVLVEALDEDGRVIARGSGTEVHPIYVATAAHVVDRARSVRYWCYSHRLGTRPAGYVCVEAEVGAIDRGADLAILRWKNAKADTTTEWTPLAETPLVAGERVCVHDFAPETMGRIWTGQALGPGQISVSGRPGSSGAGVYVLRNGRFELAALVVARTDIPPRLDDRVFKQGTSTVRVVVVETGATIAHVVLSGAIRELVRTLK